MKRIAYILLLGLLSFAGCKKQPVLELDRSSLTVEVGGSTEQVQVTANYPWTASASDSWIKVQYTEGESVLKITVSRNNDTDARNGSVTVASEDLVRTISVSQAQRNAIELGSAGRISVNAEAQSVKIQLRSNVDMEVSVQEGADWVSVASTKAMTDRTVTLNIRENTDRGMRRALVVFTDKGQSTTQQVMIDQDGHAQVLLVGVSGVSSFAVPKLSAPTGSVLTGYAYWNGAGVPETYSQNLAFQADPSAFSTLRIEAHNAALVVFETLEGVDRVDLSDF